MGGGGQSTHRRDFTFIFAPIHMRKSRKKNKTNRTKNPARSCHRSSLPTAAFHSVAQSVRVGIARAHWRGLALGARDTSVRSPGASTRARAPPTQSPGGAERASVRQSSPCARAPATLLTAGGDEEEEKKKKKEQKKRTEEMEGENKAAIPPRGMPQYRRRREITSG